MLIVPVSTAAKMAGRRQRPQQEEMETEEMDVEDLEKLVREHEQQRPSEEERRALRNLHTEIREELIGESCS